MRMRFIYIVLCMLAVHVASAQSKGLVSKGNKAYEQKDYKTAANNYLQALSKDSTYIPGMFNLGNALYQQKQYDAARKVLDNTARLEKDKNGKAAANYNIGNTYMDEQKWQEAVDAYKHALRNNPQDADAKYNLSYAQQMLKKEGGGGKDKNKDKDKKNDKNKDNKDKKDDKKDQQDKDQQDNKDNKDNKDDKKDQEKKPQLQPSKLSEKQAEQLLNALQQEEKKLQDKHKKEKGVAVKAEKDW